jgi:hypothetical protein
MVYVIICDGYANMSLYFVKKDAFYEQYQSHYEQQNENRTLYEVDIQAIHSGVLYVGIRFNKLLVGNEFIWIKTN